MGLCAGSRAWNSEEAASGCEQEWLKGTQRAFEVITSTVTSHHFFSIMTQNSKLSGTWGQPGTDQGSSFLWLQPAPLCLTKPVIAFLFLSFLLCSTFPLLEANACVICKGEMRTLILELMTWWYLDDYRSGHMVLRLMYIEKPPQTK